MEAKMLKSMWCILILAALCSVLSAKPADDVDDLTPHLDIVTKPSVFNVGEKKGLYCKGSKLSENMNWYDPSGELENKTDHSYRRFVERRDYVTHSIAAVIFQELKISDSGTWVCKAGDFNRTITIQVGKKAEVPNKTVRVEGDEGSSIRLDCEANGHPAPVVQWYTAAKPIDAKESSKFNIQRKGNVYTLEIKSLTYMDVGEYVCKITQKALSHYLDQTFILSVKHAPVLDTAVTQETFGIINEIKNLTCGAVAFPLPTFRWFSVKNSHTTEITDPELISTAENKTQSTLSLRLRSAEDLGQYTCKVSNKKGSKSVLFDVSLGSKPAVPDSVAILATNVSSMSFNVSCSQCILLEEQEEFPVNPERLPVTGYQFQLTPFVKDYLPNWDEAHEQLVEIVQGDDLVVSGLPNTTTFHVRVRSMNAAGYSDWFELTDHPSTTSHAVRVFASLVVLLIVALASL